LLRSLFAEDVMSIEAMKSRPFGETLAKLDEILAPSLYASINNPVSGFSSFRPDFEVAPAGDNKMVAKVVLPIIGPILSQTFVNAEGRWAWGDSATALKDSLQAASKELEQAPERAAGLPFAVQTELAKVDQAVGVLMQSPTRQDFHRRLDEVLPVIAEIVTQWSGYKPQAMQALAGPMADGAFTTEGMTEEMFNAANPGANFGSPAGMAPPALGPLPEN
jgi:hypothetical protein